MHNQHEKLFRDFLGEISDVARDTTGASDLLRRLREWAQDLDPTMDRLDRDLRHDEREHRRAELLLPVLELYNLFEVWLERRGYDVDEVASFDEQNTDTS